jgi:Kef-type K+ transport system membrane component KefB
MVIEISSFFSELPLFFNPVFSSFSSGVSSLQTLLSQLPESQAVLISIGIIIIVAATFALIMKSLNQEMIPAYIIAGLVIGPLVLGLVKNTVLISVFAEIGIAFLLFVAGLEISMSKLKETSLGSVLAGCFQIAIIGVAVFFISQALGFSLIASIYLALIFSFSSTILVIKLFADKYEINTLHGRIVISILLIQDIVAIFALAVLSKEFSSYFIFIALTKLVLMLSVAFILNKTILKPLFRFSSKSPELLFIVAIAFLFLFAALSYFLGFSIIIGSFIAGLALASLYYKTEIESKIRPLRDFFAIIFFVSLGMLLTSFDIKQVLIPFLIFIALVLIAKPIIIAFFVRIVGYKRRTSALAGFSLAQISEFSLVLALQGLLLGFLTQEIFTTVVLVAIVSMAITPYLIRGSTKLYSKTIGLLWLIEKLPTFREKTKYRGGEKKTVLLIGCHRMGSVFIRKLKRVRHKILIIDFNPEIIKSLENKNISAIYGDISNV